MTIGVGLIGYGMAGRVFHAPLIAAVDGLELRAIVKGRRDDVEGMLGDARVELVVIATPNTSHFDLARRALRAGKHVVVDKPFTVTSEEARQLVTLAREKGRVLSVFQNRRWEGDFLTIRQLIERGVFGRIVMFEARFDRFRNAPKPNAWRETSDPGSGILYDLGSHLIDQVLFLFGEPRSVSADVRRERDFGGSDDAFDIWMEYPRMRAVLRAGMLVREPAWRYTVRGTAATFVKSGKDPQEEQLRGGLTPRDAGFGVEPREQWGTLYTDGGEERIETLPGNYAAFYENVRDAIAGGAPLEVDPSTAITTIEIIERASASSRLE